MITTLILIASGILIGAGISIIWRDMPRRRRLAFVSERDAQPGESDPEVEITIAHSQQAGGGPLTPRASASTTRESAPAPATARTEPPVPSQPPVRRSPLEPQWHALQPAIAAAVLKVNEVLAPARVAIGTPGEPTKGFKNEGFGASRRVLVAGQSVAWLRIELTEDALLHASVKSHSDERPELDAASNMPAAGIGEGQVSDLLSQCLKPAVIFAARTAQGRGNDMQISERAWQEVDATVTAALSAANGALAQADARLRPLGPAAWEAEARRHRLTLSVEAAGTEIARMHIERLPQEMEVAVGVRDARLIELGRRRRIPTEGMTTHTLAELIAGCAWPAIARFQENRRSA